MATRENDGVPSENNREAMHAGTQARTHAHARMPHARRLKNVTILPGTQGKATSRAKVQRDVGTGVSRRARTIARVSRWSSEARRDASASRRRRRRGSSRRVRHPEQSPHQAKIGIRSVARRTVAPMRRPLV